MIAIRAIGDKTPRETKNPRQTARASFQSLSQLAFSELFIVAASGGLATGETKSRRAINIDRTSAKVNGRSVQVIHITYRVSWTVAAASATAIPAAFGFIGIGPDRITPPCPWACTLVKHARRLTRRPT